MRRANVVVFLVLCAGVVRAGELDPARARLEAVLSTDVKAGRVDYVAIKKHSVDLDAWLAAAAKVSESEFKVRSSKDRLYHVEHEMIRPAFREPRVHFALVCAAKGCPPLRSEAYDGTRLDVQLEDQARVFLSQSAKNRADPQARTAYLSPIFKWYMEDFGGSKTGVLAYVKNWLPVRTDWAVQWTEYDWSLNDDKR